MQGATAKYSAAALLYLLYFLYLLNLPA